MKPSILKKDSNSLAFNLLAGINRAINPSQVTKLATSVNLLGILRPVIVASISFISGVPVYYIIDGQHLYFALIRNNMDIPYIVINIKSKEHLVESIALLNASSKNWTITDYVTSWSSVEDDYKKLLYYFNIYDFELSTVAGILATGSVMGYNVSTIIKKGKFKVNYEDKAVVLLNNLTDVLKIVPRMNRYLNRYICSEYIAFFKECNNYNHNAFLKALAKNKEIFTLATQEECKLSQMFKEII